MKSSDLKVIEKYFGTKTKPTIQKTDGCEIRTYYEYDNDTKTSFVYEERTTIIEGILTVFKREFILEDIHNPNSLKLQKIQKITSSDKNTNNYLIEIFDSEEELDNSFPSSTVVHNHYDDIDGNITKKTTKFYKYLTNAPKEVHIKKSGIFSLYKNGSQYIVDFDIDDFYYAFDSAGMKNDPNNGLEASASIWEKFLNITIYSETRKVYKLSDIISYVFDTESQDYSLQLADGTTRNCKKIEFHRHKGKLDFADEVVEKLLTWCKKLENSKELLSDTPLELYRIAKCIFDYHQRKLNNEIIEDETHDELNEADLDIHEN